jgi:hypothetical protein
MTRGKAPGDNHICPVISSTRLEITTPTVEHGTSPDF